MVLAILNESELILSDDAVEQIVDQVQRIEINRYFQLIPLAFLVHVCPPLSLQCLVTHLLALNQVASNQLTFSLAQCSA